MKSPKILVIDASYPINTRTERFVDSFENAFGRDNVVVIAWNRDNSKSICHHHNKLYVRKASYTSKIQKLCGILGFRKFLKAQIHEFKPDIILASHWDCLYLAAGLKNEKTILIYENLDIPTGNKWIRKAIKQIERLALKKTSIITLASRFYTLEYEDFNGRKFVIENKQPRANHFFVPQKSSHSDLVLSFIGGVRYLEILRNVIDAVRGLEAVSFHIFGGGNGVETLEAYAQGMKNVFFHGSYNYKDIGNIYQQTDIVWAVYPSKDHNVKYAISNKYHESLAYGIPGIYAAGTKLADMIETTGAGFIVDCYSVADIRETLIGIVDNPRVLNNVIQSIGELKNRENNYWEEEVSSLIDYIKVTYK